MKKETEHGKTCRKYQLRVNRLMSNIRKLKKCNADRKRQIQAYEEWIEYLKKAGKLTKEEILAYSPRKKGPITDLITKSGHITPTYKSFIKIIYSRTKILKW